MPTLSPVLTGQHFTIVDAETPLTIEIYLNNTNTAILFLNTPITFTLPANRLILDDAHGESDNAAEAAELEDVVMVEWGRKRKCDDSDDVSEFDDEAEAHEESEDENEVEKDGYLSDEDSDTCDNSPEASF
jgi:hypothetical protein